MMHKIKKSAVSIKAGEQNAEFVDYKNRLDNLSGYLQSSSEALNVSEQSWKEVCNKQKLFAEQFANRYPDKDQVRDFGKRSAAASQLLVKEFVLKTEGSQAEHWQVDTVVQDYLTEIATVGAEYKAVSDQHKEVQMYTKKVDDLQKTKKPDEAKIGRNMEKLEDAKSKYDEVLDRVVECMKTVYNKRQVALKATYVAYWSSQLRAFKMLDVSLGQTREFVEGSLDEFKTLKITSMTPADIEVFVSANNGPAPPATTAVKDVPTSPIGEATPEPAAPAATAI